MTWFVVINGKYEAFARRDMAIAFAKTHADKSPEIRVNWWSATFAGAIIAHRAARQARGEEEFAPAF